MTAVIEWVVGFGVWLFGGGLVGMFFAGLFYDPDQRDGGMPATMTLVMGFLLLVLTMVGLAEFGALVLDWTIR